MLQNRHKWKTQLMTILTVSCYYVAMQHWITYILYIIHIHDTTDGKLLQQFVLKWLPGLLKFEKFTICTNFSVKVDFSVEQVAILLQLSFNKLLKTIDFSILCSKCHSVFILLPTQLTFQLIDLRLQCADLNKIPTIYGVTENMLKIIIVLFQVVTLFFHFPLVLVIISQFQVAVF